jgi:hypothetical protein
MGLASQVAKAGVKKAAKSSSSLTDLVKTHSVAKAKEVTPQDVTEYIKTTLIPKKESDKNFKSKFKDTAVVDEKNKPRVMYHGRNKDFKSFDTGNVKTDTQEIGTHIGTADQANEFATREGGNVVPAYLDIKNPLRLEDYGGFNSGEVLEQLRKRDFDEDLINEIEDIPSIVERNKAVVDLIKSSGYDGIVYLNKREGLNLKGTDKQVSSKIDELQDYDDETLIKKYGAKDSYIIFDPAQAKSVFNKGSWSGSDDRLNYNKGGTVNDMNKLFAEGGMNDEGGTVDPVSGNDVPPGSLQNEVRDDIDAKLSEGEFVIPADVVRYIGLERLMKIRDEAKQGLSRMSEIGQMGNADQVENPEALHEDEEGFDSEIDDIISEVDGEQMGEQKFARGGVVKVPEAGKDILAKYNIQRTAVTNPANDVRLLKNAAGDSLYMTYFNGKPSGRIPKGYSVVDANPASRMTGTTTAPTGVSNPTGAVSTGGVDPSITRGVDMPRGGSLVTPTMTTEPPPETPTGTTTTTGPAVNAGFTGDRGQGVNSFGGSITATDTGAVSTGIGGFTLNPDGSVTPNTIDRTVMTVAGMVNPILGVATRINNALATSSAKAFSTAIGDTMGANLNATQPAATAGPASVGGTAGTAATAASLAAADATSSGKSEGAVGAASQAAADVIVRGGSADAAAQAGRDAAADVVSKEAATALPASQQTATDIALGGQGGSAGADSLTSGADTAGRQDTGGGADTTVGVGNDGGNIDTTVGSGNDGGDEGAGTGEAGVGDTGDSTDVGSGEEEYAGGASMTAVDALGGSFAAKPMEMLQAERKGIKVEAAKGGLITRRVKKTTPAQKRGIASRK